MCDKLIDGIDTALEKFTPRKRFDTYKVIWVNHFYYLEDQ
jgi:hypothetical protein